MPSAVYLAGQHVKKSDLNRIFYTPKCIFLCLKQFQILLKVYIKWQISLHADLENIV